MLDQLNLDNRIPIVHQYIYGKIKNKDSTFLKDIPINETKIDRFCMRRFLAKHMIPVEIQNTFLKEMESYGLLKIGRKTIEVL